MPSDEATSGSDDADTVPEAETLPEAFANATFDTTTHATRATSILLLFSGAYNRPDGLAQFARQLGFEVVMYDCDPVSGGGKDADITNDDVYGMTHSVTV